MSSDAFELLVFFFMCIWMISTIYEQIKTGINDYHKSKEKIEKRGQAEIPVHLLKQLE